MYAPCRYSAADRQGPEGRRRIRAAGKEPDILDKLLIFDGVRELLFLAIEAPDDDGTALIGVSRVDWDREDPGGPAADGFPCLTADNHQMVRYFALAQILRQMGKSAEVVLRDTVPVIYKPLPQAETIVHSSRVNGDYDGNGSVNFDDYVLIDLAFNTQAGTL